MELFIRAIWYPKTCTCTCIPSGLCFRCTRGRVSCVLSCVVLLDSPLNLSFCKTAAYSLFCTLLPGTALPIPIFFILGGLDSNEKFNLKNSWIIQWIIQWNLSIKFKFWFEKLKFIFCLSGFSFSPLILDNMGRRKAPVWNSDRFEVVSRFSDGSPAKVKFFFNIFFSKNLGPIIEVAAPLRVL